MSVEIKFPKKLIEVAIPLDVINFSAAQDKGNPFLKGHPRSLHQWWARRPMLAARGILFAQLVNDPGFERSLNRGLNKAKAHEERTRLFKLIERMVKWENVNSEEVLAEARAAIDKSWRETCSLNKSHPAAQQLFNPDKLPMFHDPFAGGGAIPIEALRLGLESYATDLNPVAVLINKVMIEIPARFAGLKPVGPLSEIGNGDLLTDWSGLSGFAEDVRRYATWLKNEASAQIGKLYPQIEITSTLIKSRPELKVLIGKRLNITAWIWAKTVKSPNPAFANIDVPLVSTFTLLSKGDRHVFIKPLVQNGNYIFEVKSGDEAEAKLAASGTKMGRGGFKCLMSGSPISLEFIRAEASKGRVGIKLMAIVAESEGTTGRIYLSPSPEQELTAKAVNPRWQPDTVFFREALGFRIGNYGMSKWSDLYTNRQLEALACLSELVSSCKSKVTEDARMAGILPDERSLENGGCGPRAYGEAISVMLALAVDKFADYNNMLCTWNPTNQNVGHLFTKQTISMSWDFPESSPIFGGLAFDSIIGGIAKSLEFLPSNGIGHADQRSASAEETISPGSVISTDPPYYDNIGYADLSDFFYVWLRRSLSDVFPGLFRESVTPKLTELVATPARHGGNEAAEVFFLDGMTSAMRLMAQKGHPAFPISIYYGFKQSETESGGTSSTGWETFLEAVIRAGFSVTGTWPMRSEREARARGQNSNALASSIVLICRQRNTNATTTSRRDFVRELNATLPEALANMTSDGESSAVAPVDLSQAIIGPGMAIFSKYSAVLEANGQPMSVKSALQLINRFLAEDDFDLDTQFCLSWFDSHGWDNGKFGVAEVLTRAKGTSVDGLIAGGVVKSSGGNFKLLRFNELPEHWTPQSDTRISVWELVHHMIRRLNSDGESGAGEILAQANQYSESIRTLAYRLYTICDRKGSAADSSLYDQLVRAWDGIEAAARVFGYVGTQTSMFGEDENLQAQTSKKKTRKKKT